MRCVPCLVFSVLVHGNCSAHSHIKNKLDFPCVSENELGHFKQPKEALPKFLEKQELPCMSSLVLSNKADTALELPGGG